jgi:hypothetical protein
LSINPETQGLPNFQVGFQAQPTLIEHHCPPPGQGMATTERVTKSSLA